MYRYNRHGKSCAGNKSMAIKKFLIHDTVISVSISFGPNNKISVTIDSQEYRAKVIRFDQAKKLLFFEVNNQIHKVKVAIQDQTRTSVYVFNSQKNILVTNYYEKQEKHVDKNLVKDHNEITENLGNIETGFIPSSRTTLSQNTEKSLTLKSPLAGRIIKVLVAPNQQVVTHQPIMIIESMKMENEICAPYNAFIKTLSITEGNLVQQNQVLVTFDEIKKVIEGESDGTTKNGNEQATI